MRVRHIALENFRNVELCALDFCGARTAFTGANAQGKTNALEAIALGGALRSFRTADLGALVRRGAQRARVLLRLEHERDGEAEVEIRLQDGGRAAFLNGESVRSLAGFLGKFPFVVLSSDDIRLLRGAPAERRRAFDMLFATGSTEYLEALRRHERALRSRNALLKAERFDAASCRAFEDEMARASAVLVDLRARGLAELLGDLAACYAHLSGGAETPGLVYAPRCEAKTADEWSALFAANRQRDRAVKMTIDGVHRDDVRFFIDGADARDFASEGQQRGLVVAWRLEQAHWLFRKRGTAPVLLADDVLGELDDARKRGFWRAMPADWQVFATGTAPPTDEGGAWAVWRVHDGAFDLLSNAQPL